MSTEGARRLEMMHIIEKPGDDVRLSALVEEDEGLEAYGRTLMRACVFDQSHTQLERLLKLPALHNRTHELKQAIGEVFSFIGAHLNAPDPQIVETLYSHIKGDLTLQNQSLGSIFATALSHGKKHVNANIAKMLVENGASLEEAVNLMPLEQSQKSDTLNQFKTITLAP